MSDKAALKPDPVLKDFWSDNERFADLFNQVLFHGEMTLEPEKLSDKDTEESTVYWKKERISASSRARDIIKQYADGTELVLIGLENQMRIHYALPVRMLLYNALRYIRQCKQLEKGHRKAGDLKDGDEFLSGMAKSDRIKAVINLIVYYGEKPWDGPVKLSDMMEIPPAFRPFFNDQQVNLIEIRTAQGFRFRNQDNQDFFTLVQEFYSKDGHIDMERFKERYPKKEVYWETMAAIGAATGSRELIEYAEKNKGGRLNMCTALENLKKEGIQQGRQEGIQQGRQEGIQEGMITAYRELNLSNEVIIKKLQEKFQLSYAEAQSCLERV